MKKNHWFLFLVMVLSLQNVRGQRYIEDLFPRVDSITDIQYGEAVNYLNVSQPLFVDIYEPHNDTLQKRPVFLFAHGGGFAGGTRKGPAHIPMLCERLAKKGYVVASINYRLDPSFKIFESEKDRKVMTDAMHDMRAAIRFLKSMATTYRIDTSQIFISGESAGAATAMMAGYVDKQKELESYPKTYPNTLEGNSGHPNYSSKVKAVLCLCGFLLDTSAIESSLDAPLLLVHGSSDPLVPFAEAKRIITRAENIGLTYQKIIFKEATHCPWFQGLPNWQTYLDSLVAFTSNFMYPLITHKKAPVLARAPVPFRVATILQSNMVIQQDKPLRIWGTAASNDSILIYADWMKKSTQAYADKEGNWIGSIIVPKAKRGNFDPHTIIIVRKADTIKMHNILVGDVWICSGQSNMAYSMDTSTGGEGGVINFAKEIAAAGHPGLRLFTVGVAWEKEPKSDCRGEWKVSSPESVRNFSGVGYYYGRELLEKLQIPIGLVVNSMGGAACQGFVSRKVLEADPVLKQKYVDPYDARPEKGEHILAVLQRPSLIYNGMIYPVRNLSIKGFIWYQGESNRADGMMYAQLCTTMLKEWRSDFKQGDLPFYFVQLPAYSWGGKDSTAYDYALLREAQASMLGIKNTGMAVTMDVGEPENIHPHNKKPVGLRLAKVALNKTYNLKNIEFRGPVFERMIFDKDTAIISFESNTLGGGLTTNDGKPPKDFYIAGPDKVFYKAEARLSGNGVKLFSRAVQEPVAVRYAFTNFPVTNFENSEGLPAWPFRTDKWQ